jgi:hypothetical protein
VKARSPEISSSTWTRCSHSPDDWRPSLKGSEHLMSRPVRALLAFRIHSEAMLQTGVVAPLGRQRPLVAPTVPLAKALPLQRHMSAIPASLTACGYGKPHPALQSARLVTPTFRATKRLTFDKSATLARKSTPSEDAS